MFKQVNFEGDTLSSISGLTPKKENKTLREEMAILKKEFRVLHSKVDFLIQNSLEQSNSSLLTDKFEDKMISAFSKQSQIFQNEMKKQSQIFQDEMNHQSKIFKDELKESLKEISILFMKQLKESLELQSQNLESKLITAISTQFQFIDVKLKNDSNQLPEKRERKNSR